MNNKATLNPQLTGLAQQFMSSTSGFVGTTIAPVFNSAVPSGQYYLWDRDNYMNNPSRLDRAPGAEYQTLTSSLSSDAFVCKDIGVQVAVDDTERALYSNSFSADQAAAERATLAVMVEHERAVQEMLADPSIPTVASALDYSSAALADIKAQLRAAMESVRLNSGMRPNVCVMSETVLNALLDNPNVVGQIQYTVAAGVPNADIISRVFSLPQIAVASTIQNSANEGQTLSPADLWGDDIYLAVTNPSQDLQAVNFARTFAWTGSGMAGALSIDSYRKPEAYSDFFVSHAFRGQKLTAPKAGYSITSVLS